jgi:thymidylate kinase
MHSAVLPPPVAATIKALKTRNGDDPGGALWRPQITLINGLLIEGTDYIGKSSIVRFVMDTLVRRGIQSCHQHCYLCRHPLIDFLESQAKRIDTVIGRDWYYTCAMLLDLFLYQPQESFVVQERHWLSQVGRNEFFHPGVEFTTSDVLRECHIPFRFQIYLMSDIESKKQRAQSRPPTSPRDRLLAANPTLHQEYDEYVLGILPQHEQWTVIDTSRLNVQEVAKSITDIIVPEMPTNEVER